MLQYGGYQPEALPEYQQQYSQPEQPAYTAPQPQQLQQQQQRQYAQPQAPSSGGGTRQQVRTARPQQLARRLRPETEPTCAQSAQSKWQEFFSDPSAWTDQRASKTGNQPDFKHKSSTDKALWLNGAPPGVAEQLSQLEGGQ